MRLRSSALVAFVLPLALAGAAQAADMAPRTYTKAPPPPPAPVYTWTGFYIGGHVGGAWQNASVTTVSAPTPLLFPLGTSFSGNGSSFLGGGQIGANYQVSPNWVIGIEGDGSWTNLNFSQFEPSTLIPSSSVTATTKVGWYATVTGRLGYAWTNWMLYAKGGVAWGGFTYGGSSAGAFPATVNNLSDTPVGWTVGGGVENMITPSWSWKLEYDYLNFGSKSYAFTTTPAFGTNVNSIKLDTHMVKAGINYHFGWGGPVVANY